MLSRLRGRARILRLLPSEPVCTDVYNVNELVQEIGSSQPIMSRRLKVLKEAGLVKCRKMCSSVYYWRVPKAFERARKLIENHAGRNVSSGKSV